MMVKLWMFLLISVSILHLASCFMENPRLRKITKPFLMPLLIGVYLSIASMPSNLIIAGVTLGFLGDVFLLADKNPKCFILGLLSFLAGHILYIIAVVDKIESVRLVPILLLAAIYSLIYICIFSSIKSSLGKMKLPAFIYGLILLTLNLVAFYNLCLVPNYQNTLLFLGTILFCVSDYTLSRNIFVKPIKYGHFYIMITYILAQTLIVLGMAL